jgi:tripartite-type tricarboxylate transporter receptor subunit TctC
MKKHALWDPLVSALTWGPLVSALTLAHAAGALAQIPDDFPNRQVRMIVTQAAGSGVDLQARVLAQKMGEVWGQQLVVENRPGANAIIGMEAGAKAKPDGYTLVYTSISALTMNQTIYKKLSYDPIRDFAPITRTTANPMGMVASPAFKIKSVADFVALAKADPGGVNYGSFGIGNLTHLMGVMLSTAAGITMTHVPYKGQTPAMTDLLGGQIPAVFTTMAGASDLVETGQLNLLATFGEERDEGFPNTPTMREAGYPSVVMVGWSGLVAPAGVPPQIISRLNAAAAKALATPDLKSAFERQGAHAVSTTPAEFERFIKAETSKYAVILKAAGLEGSQ